MRKIFWAADSTVQTNDFSTYPQTGIGQVFSLFVKDDVVVENYAKNGRSTKSFIDEGRLDAIEEKIGEGDFLFIQFGHNDEKIEDPTRYTEPFSTYMKNLERFIEMAKNHKAYPVLITPLERRCFVDKKHLGIGEHSDYVAAMKQTSTLNQVPLIDLYSMSREDLRQVGEAESRKWYMYFKEGRYDNYPDGKKDNTHLRYDGAVHYASCIAKAMLSCDDYLADLIKDEVKQCL